MDPAQNPPTGGVPGPTGRRLHIAHRRSPSEMTPLVSMYTNQAMNPAMIQHNIEMLQQQLQQQQQQMMGSMMQPNQALGAGGVFAMQPALNNMSPQAGFQFPTPLQQPQQQQQQQQPQQNMGMLPQQTHSHRRNQSALPGVNMGPPPAPSSGASGSAFGNFESPASGNTREGGGPSSRGGRGGGGAGGGHQRRHSLVVADARKAAEIAQQKRTTSGFQFPAPGAAASATASSPSDKTENATGDVVVDSQSNPTPPPVAGARGRGGHGRSQSMAVGGRGGSNIRGGMGNFQGDSLSGTHDFHRRGGGSHARTSSRNFDGNWRNQASAASGQDGGSAAQGSAQSQQQQQQPLQPQQPQQGFQPGHRSRASVGGNQSISSIGAFPQAMQLQNGQMMIPNAFAGMPINQMNQINPMQLAQLQAIQQQMGGAPFLGLQNSQHAGGPGQPQQGQGQGQGQQPRKTLFTPYLPQASLPPLLANGQLVYGILRVNKKNRSDAYVTTLDGLLEADIFICGSKDRNRALEGDLVAVELLDVDEVWSQKREKEEKKKRKDITDTRNGDDSNANGNGLNNGGGSVNNGTEGGLRRRGSLRQRPTQKKNDDVEVEGQSLLLVEEEEISDDHKPLFAGHIVAVVERTAGQMFSGTLGLLRPSSQATKDKQDADGSHNGNNHNSNNRNGNNRNQDKPKIVWFKPTDKRVPLIAIPTEQAPRDFVDRHLDYADRIFVACIKRWPITSLHPFGTLFELIGRMGDLKTETDALLRDNNFASDEFSDAVLRSVPSPDWALDKEDEAEMKDRRDFRDEKTFTIDLDGTADLGNAVHVKTGADGKIEIGIHIPDVAHFVKANSLVDREAKKRGTAVHLLNRTCALLPARLSTELCSLIPDQDRLTVSVVFKVDAQTVTVADEDIWVGKSIIKSGGKVTLANINAALENGSDFKHDAVTAKDIQILHLVTQKFRETRLGTVGEPMAPLRLLQQLDDENIPIEHNIFDTTAAVELVEELMHKVNAHIAQLLIKGTPKTAILRRHAAPNPRRLQTIVDRLNALGYDIDSSSSGALQNSLFKVDNTDIRKAMETALIKSMQRAKYFVAGTKPTEIWPHYALNLPLYTHATAPTRRYIDILVHRQLESVLKGEAVELSSDDTQALSKTLDQCNTKKDSAQNAQEQSVHIDSCRIMDKKRLETHGDLVTEGIVICVYESAFDVLIPEWGFEKRVHCDQLPLKKAEFRKEKRVLELYWEKGVPSSSYVPEDERVKPGASTRMRNNVAAAAAAAHEEAERQRHEREEAARKQVDTGTISTDDADALFDDEDEDNNSDVTEAMAGASLAERPTQSVPGSPSRLEVAGGAAGADSAPQRARSDSRVKETLPESRLTDKDKYLKLFKLREEDGEYIQDVTEMTRVPIILKTDLSKSPPCLTIRSVNPYAL
ncbi:Translational repressor [Sporothrix bragantina]|uniref:Translational repressor n=1 Tax=Sporothrix bragantina TaxID=671064 RepID=A0ABP0AQD5_9PEZI